LAGSIPKAVVQHWRAEKDWLDDQIRRASKDAPAGVSIDLLVFQRRWFLKFEEILDRARSGPTWLKDARVAAMVIDSLRYRDGKVYRLDAFCVMSNHLHVVFAPFLSERDLTEERSGEGLRFKSSQPPLDSIMHSLKSFTAQEANKLIGRVGAFWEAESYDHVIRTRDEFHRVVAYVVKNPVKAGLVQRWQDWPWSWRRKSEVV
jgi:REP element-mobilizing transposase RayT